MTRRIGLGVLAALALTGWSATSRAEDLNGLGAKGQLILTADRLFPAFSYTSVSTTQTLNNATVTDTQSGTSLVLLAGTEPEVASVHTLPRVAFDFTVIDRLTLGGSVLLAFGLSGKDKAETVAGPTTTTREVDAPSRTIFGIGPRVGYILPFGQVGGIWLRGGLSFYSDRTRSQTIVNNGAVTRTDTDTKTLFSVDLDPQFVIVPIPHFFFHVGPLANITLTGSDKFERVDGNAPAVSQSNDLSVFHLGISTGLGGWFDL
jgi:hypothetical protein